MATLIVPGVRVEARFDILPPLPSPAGIVGVVGIVDRPTADGALVGVSKLAELREVLGPGTAVTMPEAVHALGNGASEVVVAPVLGGAAARLTLNNRDGAAAVLLRCRSAGDWANGRLAVEVRESTDAVGEPLRVTMRILRDGAVVETHSDLRVAPGEADDLFGTINRASSHLVALDPGIAGATAVGFDTTFDPNVDPVEIPIKNGANKVLAALVPAEGADPAGLRVVLTVPSSGIALDVHQNGLQESFRGLSLDPDSEQYLPFVLATRSAYLRARSATTLTGSDALPAATAAPQPFADGTTPGVDAYATAIDRLGDDTRIDLIVAAIEPTRTTAQVRQIHQALVAHAVAMSDQGAPRIAFGAVTAEEQKKVADVRDHASVARNRRFVLVSPAGAAGAVAGMVGRLNPQDAPTFKGVPLFGVPPAGYRESELNVLLGPTVNACVVADRRGRGVIVLKGIDTTGDQISVTRVADQAVRETKAIAENFIGSLNTESARVALKAQLVATFTRMERAGALVPSTDGSDPAFIADVYSTQQDFAQGIIRIDIAVRPVRAIDYVYATIRVKN
ncbi:MAG TPA: phage tail sheath C-terminal domain-containing protein [Phytomonospora sp.]